MTPRLTPIRYRIACYKSTLEVAGYAIPLPAPFTGLRFCLRREARSGWIIDHFDSGMSFGGPLISVWETSKAKIAYMRKWTMDDRTRASSVRWLVRYLRHLHRTGKLRKSMAKIGYSWCLDEAGL